jgi:hypothetical protein
VLVSVQVWFAQQGCVAPPQLWQVPATHTVYAVGHGEGGGGKAPLAGQQGWLAAPQATHTPAWQNKGGAPDSGPAVGLQGTIGAPQQD